MSWHLKGCTAERIADFDKYHVRRVVKSMPSVEICAHKARVNRPNAIWHSVCNRSTNNDGTFTVTNLHFLTVSISSKLVRWTMPTETKFARRVSLGLTRLRTTATSLSFPLVTGWLVRRLGSIVI